MIRFISGGQSQFPFPFSHNFISSSAAGGSSAAASVSYNQNSNRVRQNGGGGRDGFPCQKSFLIGALSRHFIPISTELCKNIPA